MKTAILSGAFALAATTAFAGSYAAPQPDPVIAAPVVTATSDWTGAYVGLSAGTGHFDEDALGEQLKADEDIYGAFAGYDYDFGKWVIGASVDDNHAKMTYSGEDITGNLLHVRGRVGYDLGKFLPYVTAGWSHLSVSGIADHGYNYGAGLDYRVRDNLVVGAEYTMDRFDDFGGYGIADFRNNVVQLRVAYKF